MCAQFITNTSELTEWRSAEYTGGNPLWDVSLEDFKVEHVLFFNILSKHKLQLIFRNMSGQRQPKKNE